MSKKVENFDDIIGLSFVIKEDHAECKLLQLKGTTEFPDYPYCNIHGETTHIHHYKVIAERQIDTMHIYAKPKIDNIFIDLKKNIFQIIFNEKKKCVIANEIERNRFLTCPAYPYRKGDKRLKGNKSRLEVYLKDKDVEIIEDNEKIKKIIEDEKNEN